MMERDGRGGLLLPPHAGRDRSGRCGDRGGRARGRRGRHGRGSLAGLRTQFARRRGALSWEEPSADPALGPVAAGLGGLPERERAAVVAQAVGLTPAELTPALGLEEGEGPALLARGHAALAGLGRPADRECAAEREALAADEARRGRAATGHCENCRAFAAALAAQRPELRRAAARAGRPPARPAGGRGAVRGLLAADGRVAHRALALLEPRGRPARLGVALLVTAVASLSGFGLVRALDDGRPAGPRVVTATPVEPLPPGVNTPP